MVIELECCWCAVRDRLQQSYRI